VLKGLLPSRPVSPTAQLADEVSLRLRNGGALGPALRASFPVLSTLAVERAVARFEGGAVALLIVDVRDGLVSLLSSSAAELRARDAGTWTWTSQRLERLAEALAGDTFVQHLINTCLETTGVYTESHALERDAVDVERLARAVTELLCRSLPAVLSRAELAQSVTRPDDYAGGVEQPA
jgi:hypothetical protein